MTNIDPTRLAAIFRGLSAKESQNKTLSKNSSVESSNKENVASVEIKSNLQRDKDQLKRNIYLRLSKLKAQDASYQEKAPGVVIKEILLWEFGEGILQHPEYNYFSQTIIDQVKGHKELEAYLKDLIKKFKEHAK